MSTRTAEQVLTAIETALAANPSLGVAVLDSRQGITSAANSEYSVSVTRAATDNLNLYRDQTVARVEDTVDVALSFRLKPKDQITSRNAALAKELQIINRLTELGSDLAAYSPRYEGSSMETPTGEWQRLVMSFTMTRDQQVGAG